MTAKAAADDARLRIGAFAVHVTDQQTSQICDQAHPANPEPLLGRRLGRSTFK
jgi:hypothetical protein